MCSCLQGPPSTFIDSDAATWPAVVETKESRKKKQSGNSGSNGKEENCAQRKTHKMQDKSTNEPGFTSPKEKILAERKMNKMTVTTRTK